MLFFSIFEEGTKPPSVQSLDNANFILLILQKSPMRSDGWFYKN